MSKCMKCGPVDEAETYIAIGNVRRHSHPCDGQIVEDDTRPSSSDKGGVNAAGNWSSGKTGSSSDADLVERLIVIKDTIQLNGVGTESNATKYLSGDRDTFKNWVSCIDEAIAALSPPPVDAGLVGRLEKQIQAGEAHRFEPDFHRWEYSALESMKDCLSALSAGGGVTISRECAQWACDMADGEAAELYNTALVCRQDTTQEKEYVRGILDQSARIKEYEAELKHALAQGEG